MRTFSFDGRQADFIGNIDFDEKAKRFRSVNNSELKHRNLANSLVEVVCFPILQNYNDRYDKIFLKSMKTVLLLLANNLFALKLSSFQHLFRALTLAHKTARNQPTKQFARGLIFKLFEVMIQRIALENFFFNATNPLAFFYSDETKRLIEAEVGATLQLTVDQVVAVCAAQENNGGFRSELSKADFERTDVDLHALPVDRGYVNERGEANGVFGWCYVCRAAAQYYCKEKRIPICSYECKLRNLENQERYARSLALNKRDEREEISFNKKYIEMFNALSEKCFDRESEKERGVYLDILHNLVKNPSNSLRRDPRFITFIKRAVLPNLTRTTMQNDDSTLKTSLLIFLNIVLNFRKYFRVEIGIFIQDVFLEILESVNSKFIFKYYILQILTSLVEEKTLPFELFLNYDCREGSANICEKIIDLLVKISQGKYQKNVYSALISPAEEEELRKDASQALVHLIRGCSIFMDSSELASEDTSRGIKDVIKKKKAIDEAFLRFNAGKSSGIKLLKELGVIGEGPEAMARFIKDDRRVGPFMIGEIFGDPEDFNTVVRETYLEWLAFNDMSVLEALKYYLSLFELPGESQKVERILESFAKQYTLDNPGTYTQDATHLLSFLLMMLHTNIHNPQVIDKMNLQSFLNIGKNIDNGGKPVSQEVLTRFYHEIVATPLAVHSLEKRKREIQDSLVRSFREKQELFKLESIKLIENYSLKAKDFDIADDYQFVENSACLQLFISTMWTSLMAFFSTSIANCEDIEYLTALVDATMSMIKLLDVFNMQTERDSFINLLVQFSGLEKTFNSMLNEKNLLLMRSVIAIATKMGNHLHSGWKFVLNCIVSINYYQIQADKIRQGEVPAQTLSIEDQNALFVANYFTKDHLNLIFMDSEKLDEHSILDFIGGLSALTIKEIESHGQRIHYILEQIVVVLNFNIARNPLELLRIWDLVDKLYERIIDKNSKKTKEVVIFSIDILRQLVLCCFDVG